MAKQYSITRNGQKVTCYGEWKWDSNAECVFEDERCDGIFADGADNWTEVVEIMTAFAASRGTVLVEMSAC